MCFSGCLQLGKLSASGMEPQRKMTCQTRYNFPRMQSTVYRSRPIHYVCTVKKRIPFGNQSGDTGFLVNSCLIISHGNLQGIHIQLAALVSRMKHPVRKNRKDNFLQICTFFPLECFALYLRLTAENKNITVNFSWASDPVSEKWLFRGGDTDEAVVPWVAALYCTFCSRWMQFINPTHLLRLSGGKSRLHNWNAQSCFFPN